MTLTFTVSSAQQLDLGQYLPHDKTVKKGVLPNGLTYYLKKTDVVKGTASYYIIQNVGSILENDDQQGLAHFLEHMAFNGTKTFEGKKMLETFQKEGLVFGRDVNAYTSFDETVYNINNVPTRPELIEKGLLVLRDWCNYLLLTGKEIDAERGVIKEEWRMREGPQMRLLRKSLPQTFNHSKYADRLPIGLMSIVENFKYKVLRDFYHDWYRTDLQAIAIVGDIDVAQIEAKVKKMFSAIPAVKNPKERYLVRIPDNDELLYSLGMDAEVSTSNISFGIRHYQPAERPKVKDLKKSLLQDIATGILSDRLREKSQQSDSPFLNTYVNYYGMVRLHKEFSLFVTPKPNQQEKAFTALLTELIRAVKFGYTDSEIARKVKEKMNNYETRISKWNDRSHADIMGGIQNNYLYHKNIPDVNTEYPLAKKILKNLKPSDVHNAIKSLYTKNNRFLNVVGVKGHDNLTKEKAEAIFAQVEHDPSIKPYADGLSGKTLMSGITLKGGSIAKVEQNKALNSTTYTLSNGIKVHYKFTDKQKNTVKLEGISDGGKSLLKDADLPSATLLEDLIGLSGLSDYSKTDLSKILSGKTASAGVDVKDYHETVSGSATIKDAETMMQLLYLRFVKPRFVKETYDVMQGHIDNYLAYKRKDLKAKMQDSLTVSLYGNNNPRKPILDKSFFKKVSFEKMKAIYSERFKNPADFEFFVVGDIKEAQLKPLLAKYLGGLKTTAGKEQFRDNNIVWLSDHIDKDVFLEMKTPKVSVRIGYKVANDYSKVKNKLVTRALGDVMLLRLTELLREEEGGVYSPGCRAYMVKEPKNTSYLSVSFDCNPDLAEKLIRIVHDELAKIAKGQIKDKDLSKTLKNYKKDRVDAKNKNAYSMRLLKTFYRDGYNMNDPKNFEKVIDGISKKDLKKLAKRLLKKGESYEVVFKPEK